MMGGYREMVLCVGVTLALGGCAGGTDERTDAGRITDAASGPGDAGEPGLDGGVGEGDAGSTMDAGTGGSVADGTLVVSVNGELLTLPTDPAIVNTVAGSTGFYARMSRITLALTFPGTEAGTYTCQIDYGDSRDLAMPRGGQGMDCDVVVTEYGPPGGPIRGTFTAMTSNTTGTFEFTGGAFSVMH